MRFSNPSVFERLKLKISIEFREGNVTLQSEKTVLITGASSGMGKAIARLFSTHGWNVVATMRRPEGEMELNTLENLCVSRLDVTDQASIDTCLRQAIDEFGRIDVLVNNAGVGALGFFGEASDHDIYQQFDVNTFGVMRVTRSLLPHFHEQCNGCVISVTSLGARVQFSNMSLYCGAKAAVESWSASLQLELRPFGIDVKVVEPGGYRTDFTKSKIYAVGAKKDTYDGFREEYMAWADAAADRSSKGPQLGEPAEVAEIVYRAATDGKTTFRYSVGKDARSLLWLKTMLPDGVFRRVIGRLVGPKYKTKFAK